MTTSLVVEIGEKKKRTESILKKVNTLPPNFGVLQEVLRLLNDVNTSPHTLAKVVSRDLSLMLKVLTIANSPFYMFTKQVSSIEYAITILRYDEIRNIVDALSLMESMKDKNDQYLDHKEFWLHSYLTANIAKKLAMDMGLEKHSEAFIAGLLHDFGISVIHRFMHSDFVSIHELVANGMTYNEAEMEVLGMTHGEVGEFLLNYWNIPKLISEIVRCHHAPSLAQTSPTLTAIIQLADYMTQVLKIGEFHADLNLQLDINVYSKLHIKDLIELSHFIEGYREPLQAQSEALKYLF